jgi:hypothetical protein
MDGWPQCRSEFRERPRSYTFCKTAGVTESYSNQNIVELSHGSVLNVCMTLSIPKLLSSEQVLCVNGGGGQVA